MKLHIEIYNRLSDYYTEKQKLENQLQDENLLVRLDAEKKLERINARISELSWVLSYTGR